MEIRCKNCTYYSVKVSDYPCCNCDDTYSLFVPNSATLVKEAREHLNNLTKENNMNNITITVDGKSYKANCGTFKMSQDSYAELELEVTLAPYNEIKFGTTIVDVIFNPPATIVFWSDNTKTVVQARGDDTFDPEKGLAMAISKKMLGNKRDYYHTFQHYQKKFEKQEKEIVNE